MSDDEILYDGKTLGSYRVADLKGYLKQYGLSGNGNKAVLVTRLADFMREKGLVGGSASSAAGQAPSTTVMDRVSVPTIAEPPELLANRSEMLISLGREQQENAEQHIRAAYMHQLQLQQIQQQQYQQYQLAALQNTVDSNNFAHVMAMQQTTTVFRQPEIENGIVGGQNESANMNNQYEAHPFDGSQDTQPTNNVYVEDAGILAAKDAHVFIPRDETMNDEASKAVEMQPMDVSEEQHPVEADEVLQAAGLAESVLPTGIDHQTVNDAASTLGGEAQVSVLPHAQRSLDDEVSFAIDQDDLQRYIGGPIAKRPPSSSSASRSRHRGDNVDDAATATLSSAADVDVGQTGNHYSESTVRDAKRKLNASSDGLGSDLTSSVPVTELRNSTTADNYADQQQQQQQLADTLPVTQGAPKHIKLRRNENKINPPSVAGAHALHQPQLPEKSASDSSPPTAAVPNADADGTLDIRTDTNIAADDADFSASSVPVVPHDAVTAGAGSGIKEDENIGDAAVDNSGNSNIAPPDVSNATDVLLIRNLMRPFTILQLRQLIEQHGHVLDGDENMWLDRIKSQCICKMASIEDARKVVLALNRITWPDKSYKQLYVRFENEDMLRELVERTKKGEDISPHQIIQERAEEADPKRNKRSGDDSSSRRRNSFQQQQSSGADVPSATSRKQSNITSPSADTAAGGGSEDPSVLVTVSVRERRFTKDAETTSSSLLANSLEKSSSDRKNDAAAVSGGGAISAAAADSKSSRTKNERGIISAPERRVVVNEREAGLRTSERRNDANTTSSSRREDDRSGRNNRDVRDSSPRGGRERDEATKTRRTTPPKTKEPTKTLDELFPKTVAKPTVYYMTVSADTFKARREHRGIPLPAAPKNITASSREVSAAGDDSNKARTASLKQLTPNAAASLSGKASARGSDRPSPYGRGGNNNSSSKLAVIDERTDVRSRSSSKSRGGRPINTRREVVGKGGVEKNDTAVVRESRSRSSSVASDRSPPPNAAEGNAVEVDDSFHSETADDDGDAVRRPAAASDDNERPPSAASSRVGDDGDDDVEHASDAEEDGVERTDSPATGAAKAHRSPSAGSYTSDDGVAAAGGRYADAAKRHRSASGSAAGSHGERTPLEGHDDDDEEEEGEENASPHPAARRNDDDDDDDK